MDGASFYGTKAMPGPDQESAGKMGQSMAQPAPAGPAGQDPTISVEPLPGGAVRLAKVFPSMPEALAFLQAMGAQAPAAEPEDAAETMA